MHVKFTNQFTHYLILFQELESNKKILVGGASAASEATLSSCPLRFAVYVGIIGGASAASEATLSSCPLRFAVYVAGR